MESITAIVLNGGTASRMQPLSENRAKCMISFLGRPLLDHLLETFRLQGIKNIIFTSSGRHGEVQSRYMDGRDWDLSIQYVDDIKWRGTAGSSRDVGTLLGDSLTDPVMIVYGDSFLSADFKAMVQYHKKTIADITILSHKPDFSAFQYEYHDGDKAFKPLGRRTNYGVMELNERGRIINFVEKELLENISNYIRPVANAAVYIVNREVLFEIPKTGSIDFSRDIFPSLVLDRVCMAFDIGLGYRIDIGTLSIYHAAQLNALLGEFTTVLGPTKDIVHIGQDVNIASSVILNPPYLIGDRVIIEEDVIIKGSIIGNDVYIRRGTRIFESIVLDGVEVDEEVTANQVIAAEMSRIEAGKKEAIVIPRELRKSIVSFKPMTREHFIRLL